MEYIENYKTNVNGKFDVLLKNVTLSDKETLLLDNGIKIEANLDIQDPFKITGKQRRKIFALCNDIENATGQPREHMREMFQDYITFLNGYDKRLSLSNCSREQARQLIEVILDWVFHNNIPLNYKTSDLLKNDKAFLYWSTVNRNCVICGKRGELAHHKAIGRGANRRKMDHYGYEVLCLCREHHQSQHDMGVETFDKLHHLENSWLSVDERLNKMLKGAKIHEPNVD